MVLKQLSKSPRRPKPQKTAAGDEPSGIAALIKRATLTTFSVRHPPNDVCRRLWVQETVERHGYRAAFLPGVVTDWSTDHGSQYLANLILSHCQELGLISETERMRKTHLFALEVCRNLGENFRMCALHVLLWQRRDMTGFELVRESQSAAE